MPRFAGIPVYDQTQAEPGPHAVPRQSFDAVQPPPRFPGEPAGPAPGQTDYRAALDAEYAPLPYDQSGGPVDWFMQNLSRGANRELVNFGRGWMDIMEGGKQALLEGTTAAGLTDPKTLSDYNQGVQQERQLFDQGDIGRGGVAKFSRFAGEVAPAAAIPAASAEAALGTRLLTNAAAGGAIGGSQFVEPDSGQTRLGNTAVGALAGAAGAEALRGLMKGAVSAVQYFRRATTPLDRQIAQVVAQVGDDAPEATKRRAVELLRKGLTPEQAARAANMEEIGLQPTRGQITRNLADAQFENRMMSNADEAAAPIRERAASNNRALLEQLDQRVAQQGGKVSDSFDAGASVQEGIRAGKAARHAETDQAYSQLRELLPPNMPVKLNRLAPELADAMDFAVETPAVDGVAKRLQRWGVLDKEGQVVGDLTIDRAETLRRVINDKMDGASLQSQRVLGRIRDALTTDIRASVGEDAYAPARAVAQREFGLFDNRRIVNEIMRGKLAPDDVVRRIASKSTKGKDVAELVDTLAGNSQTRQSLKDLRAGMMEYLKGKALLGRQLNLEGDPVVSGANFVKAVRDVGRQKLEPLYGKEQTAELFRVANLMNEATNRARNVGSSANTAETLESIVRVTQRASNIPGLATFTEPWVRRMKERALEKGARAAVEPISAIAKTNRGVPGTAAKMAVQGAQDLGRAAGATYGSR